MPGSLLKDFTRTLQALEIQLVRNDLIVLRVSLGRRSSCCWTVFNSSQFDRSQIDGSSKGARKGARRFRIAIIFLRAALKKLQLLHRSLLSCSLLSNRIHSSEIQPDEFYNLEEIWPSALDLLVDLVYHFVCSVFCSLITCIGDWQISGIPSNTLTYNEPHRQNYQKWQAHQLGEEHGWAAVWLEWARGLKQNMKSFTLNRTQCTERRGERRFRRM